MLMSIEEMDKEQLIDQLAQPELAREMIPALQKMPVVEVGELLEDLDDAQILEILPGFTPEQQGLILSEFDVPRQYDLFELADRRWFAQAFEHMYSESRADLFQMMEPEDQASILPYISKVIREDVIRLSSYPPETAGGIMSTDFATVLEDMTCEQAIAKVRTDAPSKRMVYYVYVVDKDMRMTGFITLKNLIMAAPSTPVREAMHEDYAFALTDEDRESVAGKIEKYDLVAIPVLNHRGQLVGIVTHDEAIEVIRAEHTEDLEKFMGIVPGKDDLDYEQTTAWGHFRKRIFWLLLLAVVGLISGLIIHRFENALEALLILALYMPMIADTGGNAGSQAATVVIRAMALGQINPRKWLFVLWKELRISLLLAVCLGLVAFGKVLFLSWETDIPALYNLTNVALVISVALTIQVIPSTLIGAGLPVLVKRLGGDPAIAASPAITTLVDITGLLIYFGMAVWFLGLS